MKAHRETPLAHPELKSRARVAGLHYAHEELLELLAALPERDPWLSLLDADGVHTSGAPQASLAVLSEIDEAGQTLRLFHE